MIHPPCTTLNSNLPHCLLCNYQKIGLKVLVFTTYTMIYWIGVEEDMSFCIETCGKAVNDK